MPDNERTREGEDIMILPEYPDMGIPETDPQEDVPASPYPDPDNPFPTPSLPGKPPAPQRPPADSTPSLPGNGGTGTGQWPPITIYPIPILPSPQGNRRRYCTIRFLNAAVGYDRIHISLGNQRMVNSLGYGELTSYFIERSGFRDIRVMDGMNQGSLLSVDTFLLAENETYTAAFVNGINGPSMYLMTDYSCADRYQRTSCVRVANLSYNAQTLDVSAQKGEVRFEDLTFKTVSTYKRVLSGNQEFVVTDAISGIMIFHVRQQIQADRAYTMYIIGNAYGTPPLEGIFGENYSRLEG